MIFFFTVVTVIVPAFVLVGIVIFAARDAVEDRREREAKGSPDGSKVQSPESSVESLPTSAFGIRHWDQLHKTHS